MMIGAFKKSFAVVAKNPFVLLPAIAVSLISAFIMDAVFGRAFDIFVEFALEGRGLTLGIFEMISLLYKLYALDILLFLLGFIVSMTMTAMLLFFYTKNAMHYTEKDSFSISMKYMLSRISRAFGLVIVWLVFSFLFGVLLFGLAILLPANLTLVAVVFVALLVLFGLIFLKLAAFCVPAMVLDDAGVRQGLSKSWAFTDKRLLETILAVIVVLLTTSVIWQVGWVLISPLDGPIALIVSEIFTSFIFAFGSLFFAFYYFDNQGTTPKKAGHKTRKRK